MTDAGALNRRTFLASIAASGGALTLGFDLERGSAQATSAATEITAWIVIAPDDQVTIRIAKSEMGQGVFTGLAMLVAEERACDWRKVRAELVAPRDNLARGRRHCARDADCGGGRTMGCCECRMPRQGGRGDAHGEWPRRPLRRNRGSRRARAAAHAGHAQGCQGLDAHRPADATAR